MITVLISLLVSLLVVCGFRYLDRNNRSVEKVKKYTDKIKAEFDTYFGNQQQELKNKALDLDVQKTQAIASVKSLQNLQKEFTEKKNTLDSQISEIAKMGEKISGYDKSLKELTQMSLAVEENLEKIKKEAGIIDKLDSKLTEQKKLLDALEKRIPATEQNFNNKNSETLSSIGKNLLNEYKEKIEEIKFTTTEAIKRNEEIISQITDSFDNVFATAAQKAENLEAVVFQKLKEKSEERALKYKELADENNNKLKESIKSDILTTQDQLKFVQSETKILSQNLTQELERAN
ncbi:MAG: hypothetical protein II232_03485, partial [Spirochaetaceae bacterium]|nr:hypothetical protein [Spirochaetaceae bacterium]